DRVAWFEFERGRRVEDEALLRWGGGLVAPLADTGLAANGWQALLAARKAGAPLWSSWQWMNLGIDVAQVRAQFNRMVPRGIIYSPEEPVPRALAALSARERRAIFSSAIGFARHLQFATARRSRFDVTSLCAG